RNGCEDTDYIASTSVWQCGWMSYRRNINVNWYSTVFGGVRTYLAINIEIYRNFGYIVASCWEGVFNFAISFVGQDFLLVVVATSKLIAVLLDRCATLSGCRSREPVGPARY